MRIYIVEDDISVISILEDIIEDHDLGEVCGDCGGQPADVEEILRARPDVILVDFFMPVMDGVELCPEAAPPEPPDQVHHDLPGIRQGACQQGIQRRH